MTVTINDAYYKETAARLQSSPVDGFSAVLAQHKANMVNASFREPAAEVFKKNLNWIAEQIVTKPGTNNFKDPADITDDDIRKLEILKADYGFDYLQDLRISWTTTKNNRQLPYKEPFLMYMAGKKGDLTDYQTEIITQLIDKCNAEGKPWSLGISYCARSGGRGANHNEKKNLFHVLLEGELTPNKKKIADHIPDEVAREIYQIYARTYSWRGSYGQSEYKDYDTYRNGLHSAVASGRIENVEYAMSRGLKQSTVYNNTGSTAFADAVARDKEPAYHAIALRLMQDAMAQEDGAKILNDASRWDDDSITPIQQLARRGNIAFTLALARATNGAPGMALESFTYAEDETPRGSHTVGAAVEASETEYAIKPSAGEDSPFLYLHQAVFNINPSGAFYGARQDIFGKAMKHLVEKGVLNEEQIPKDSLTDQRALNFIFSVRAAADAEKRRNPDFLEKNADFTEGFSEEVRRASTLTNNFRVIYDPERPDETSAKAYDDAGLSTGNKIAVKTLKLKKPSS